MSLIKLLFVKYDISNINSEGYYISHNTKTIRDLNHNEIIYLPFLIDEVDKLYKIELCITEKNLFIYVYINYTKLRGLIKNNFIIPSRNQLFELFKKNINEFKFNSKLFKQLHKNCFFKTTYNSNNSSNLILKTYSDDVIIYKDLYINLKTQSIKINNYLYKKLIRINSYIIFKPDYSLLSIINNKTKTLIVTNNEINYKKIYINSKNYKKWKLSDIINENIIFLDINLLKKCIYFKKYREFHSLNNYEYAYNNFKDYIDNLSNKNILFFNIELLNFDKVIFINTISEKLLCNKNFVIFNKLIKAKEKIYLENLFTNNYDYNTYKLFRKYIIPNNNFYNNIELNEYIIKNNIIISSEILNKKINNIVIKYKPEPSILTNLNINVPTFCNLFIFEKLFEMNNITFDFKIIMKNYNNNICPITYDNYSNNLFVELECGHTFSLFGFINYLCFNNKCPICQELLNYSKLKIVGTPKIMKNILINNIISKKHDYSYIIVNDDKFVEYLNYRYSFLKIKNTKFVKLNNILKEIIKLDKKYNMIYIYYLEKDYPSYLEICKLNFIVNNIYKLNSNIVLNKII